MIKDKAPYISAVAIASFLGVFAFLAGTHFVMFKAAWCIAGEDHCVREWVSALSGWAAFIGAAIALPYLAAQAREAQTQTAFSVGDAAPEFVVTRDRRERRTILTVRNWNRSLIMIDVIKVTHDNRVAVSDISDFDDPSVPSWQQQRCWGEQGAFRVAGWIDRGKPPVQRRLKLLLSLDGEVSNDVGLIASKMEFTISYRIVGQRHRRASAKVTTLEIADE
ncbi:hypothetical protein [Mesorhizobium sp.]|uniref:hypothetical protein n=1 Tax=Mesorhizobium sp. TaxID=1871066 RepID=UPI000FE6F7C6|nr:hypothetical protein [Mesorhizobium sp.]RWB29614.1 MAG: hypothetical protein EOQ41_16005 [Mesorhizobium sp.]RWE96448.1 MAG: hypothetical protein EOS43_22355 [Mesorhizobium sp.]